MLDRKKIVWFILLRLMVATVFLASLFFFDLHSHEGGDGLLTLTVLTRLVAATYGFSLVSLLALKFTRKEGRAITYAQIVWDLFLVTTVILITGGVNSPYAFLYFLSIVSASVLLARSEAYYTASLCIILYGAILDFQYYGRLVPLGISPLPALQYGAGYVFYLIFLYAIAFFLTAYLAGSLAERARVSESALQEKVIDFQELERLNTSIVSTIDSGLVTVNTEGRIRVFNRWAEQLTGLSQAEAYDRLLVEVIPGFARFGRQFFGLANGEFSYEAADGQELLISFKSVPLTGSDGEPAGALLDLNDLTQIRRMAGELERADRLAAVGELSARMAHEIRNPLAAISGSVQLAALRGWVDEKDKRLFSIIVRETDRLDTLLRDFLLYARPAQPAKVPVRLKWLIADLCALLNKDPRFAKVSMENRVPESLVVVFDKDQCSQIFWNLMVNGAEAIAGEGSIEVSADLVREGAQPAVVLIRVSDNGAGMSPADVKRAFEPFFTTKRGGTGLGLATVYRIVDAHGGRVTIDSAQDEGTTVTISLPA
ncbi:two-component system sensor histidine kinase NtrB [Geomonas sp.]|uniref:two-component system sensor histidine kinase NtrB n=1 Tax=Geomonas sp. TaxID=2651584 RepID=UPI002B47BAA0|nr:ATP-binding protein [Geomonas sp.]HJV37189.1 ATP-binding protein [Geomonas sp.]